MSSYFIKNKLSYCSCFWGYATFFVTGYYITSWNQTWILHRKWLLMLWQFYKPHSVANTKTLVRTVDVNRLPRWRPQKLGTAIQNLLTRVCAWDMCAPELLFSSVTYISNTFLSVNFCTIYLHFPTSPMTDTASHNYVVCYVCVCGCVQLCGNISESAEFPDAFLTAVWWTYFHFVYDGAGCAVCGTSVSCHINL